MFLLQSWGSFLVRFALFHLLCAEIKYISEAPALMFATTFLLKQEHFGDVYLSLFSLHIIHFVSQWFVLGTLSWWRMSLSANTSCLYTHIHVCSHVHYHLTCICVFFWKKTSRELDIADDILALPFFFKFSERVQGFIAYQYCANKKFIHPHDNYLVARTIFSSTVW